MSSPAPPLPALLWMAPALSGGGYSSESLSFGFGLWPRFEAAGVPFTLRQFAEEVKYDVYKGMTEEVRRGLSKFYEPPNPSTDILGPRDVVVCHSTPDAWVPSKFPGWDDLAPCPPHGTKATAVGRTMFETDRLPADWVKRCNKMDEIWVPTEFHKRSFAAAGVSAAKLFVLGEPVDTAYYNPEMYQPLELPIPPNRATRPFTFLSVFKWERRKGWDALLAAYFAEFGADEPVELVLKTKPFHSDADFDEQIAAFAAARGLPAERPAVRVMGSELDHAELPRLYRAADAFVIPSRGEGWGRPHVEAMAMGLPVIATNWSGPTAYLDESVGYPLQYSVEEVADELRLPGHRWAEPSVGHLRELMREVYERPDEARRRGVAARMRMGRWYSPEAMADAVVSRLEHIAEVRSGGGAKAAGAKRKKKKAKGGAPAGEAVAKEEL